MEELPNIDKLNKDQLEQLKEQIEQKLYGFWAAIEKIDHYRKERGVAADHFKEKEDLVVEKSEALKRLYANGWSIVIYDLNRVGIINYGEPKEDASFYGCTFNKEKNELIFDGMRKPSGKDIESLEILLEIKG